MTDAHSGLSPAEQEWRTCVTAIQAAAEILRDYRYLQDAERAPFVTAIIEESDRLRRTFERATDECTLAEAKSPGRTQLGCSCDSSLCALLMRQGCAAA